MIAKEESADGAEVLEKIRFDGDAMRNPFQRVFFSLFSISKEISENKQFLMKLSLRREQKGEKKRKTIIVGKKSSTRFPQS